MKYILNGHEFIYEVQTMIQVFFPNERYKQVEEPAEAGFTVLSGYCGDSCEAILFKDGQALSGAKAACSGNIVDIKRAVKLAIYTLLNEFTGIRPAWGLLTGVRPVKIVSEALAKGSSVDDIKLSLINDFLITEAKADLCVKAALAEAKILAQSYGASLYAGIPFCPTRCLYCSFTSYSTVKHGALIKDYLTALYKDLDFLAGLKRKIETVYIGGGTPSSLEPADIEGLLEKISTAFDTNGLREFTFEAGRPDTITEEKLNILKTYGVSRVSVNPQTLNQKTLDLIGRKHTSDDFFKAYETAAGAGFDVNVDLILGLPDETAGDVFKTFQGICRLRPDSVTVHTLAVKRASKLNETLGDYALTGTSELETMLEIAAEQCASAGLEPYYMYRQKNMLGNFENVGYCRPGKECVYNIRIMEEKQDILAAGAGAVSKAVDLAANRVERAYNVNEPAEYINRIDEMIERKRLILI